MRRLFIIVAVLAASAAPLAAQPRAEPLADEVRRAIDKGIRYLRNQQAANGGWEADNDPVGSFSVGFPGGQTSLALLALLNAGLPATDPAIARGLAYLRTVKSDKTYVVGLQNLVYAEARLPEDLQRIQDNVQWLLKARVYLDGKLLGWWYGAGAHTRADNSNSQYALLGLWAAQQAGVDLKPEVWKEIQAFYARTQFPNGSWAYDPGARSEIFGGPRYTMTTAGLCGLLIAGMELNVRREILNLDGTAANCGEYGENPQVQKALHWLGTYFTVEIPNNTFYHLYGVERAGRLSGLRYFGNHDWYREGCEFLVKQQNKASGAWQIGVGWDGKPTVSTSFALLFLSKGRTPVLISKMVHGAWPRVAADTDWNNDRDDLRNLTQFVGKEQFKTPLAWQTFDLARGIQAQAKGDNVTEDDYLAVTSEMLQSPILYITGHRSPLRRVQGAEKTLLKRYVENGGFILAEACCGSKEFDEGFRDLVAELWPGGSFDRLPADHPVYRGDYLVTPGQPYELWGLIQGCKTVLVYSPQDLSCRWEKGMPKDPKEAGDTVPAFRVGANIVAYVTGKVPPQPRLTKMQVAGAQPVSERPPRGFVQIAQLRIPGDAPPAPKAMRNLLEHVNLHAGLDVHLDTKHLPIDGDSVVNYKFVYLHGRKEFAFDPTELDRLRFNLQSGGLLFADACCGKESFDKSFRAFMTQLLPKSKLEPVPLGDELYGKDLAGEALTENNIECRTEAGGPMRRMAPFLEGIKHDGRWIVLYSKYDIGCALERHQASDCRGYSPASAQKLARAALLYTLRP